MEQSDTREIPLTHRAEAAVIRGFLGLLRLLPYPHRVRIGGWVFGKIVGPLTGQRQRIRNNLALVWPDMPLAKKRQLERLVPSYIGRSLIELFNPEPFSEIAQAATFEGPGLAALEKSNAEGRPAILVSGHIGNYDVIRSGLTQRGYHIGGLYREMGNKAFNADYVATIRNIAEPLFAQGHRGMAEMVAHLKSGGNLAVLIDQHMDTGAPVTFFGKTALTGVSAARLALKYNATVIPCYAIRQADGLSFRAVLEAPVPQSDAVTMTQALNDSLEAQVRAHPEQWLWTHRRWKGGNGV